MKKYILLILGLFFSVQVFAQKESLEERYTIPEGQIIKLYKHTNMRDVYFFDSGFYGNVGLTYIKYLLLKDSRILTIKKNSTTSIVTIVVSNELKRQNLKEQILEAIEEFKYVVQNYDNYTEEIENIIYQGDN